MDQKPWRHAETESEESEGTGSSEDETDEEEEKQKYVRKENEKRRLVSPAWKKESSSEEESESESGGAVSSPSRGGKQEKDPRFAGSGSDSESESDVSSDEAKMSIGRLLASDRKPSSKKNTAEAPPPKNVQVQREDAAKKEKSESQRRKRDNQKDEEGNANKRKKENETRSSTRGGKTHSQPAQEESLIGQKSKKEKKAAAQNGQMAIENDKSAQKKKAVKETVQVQPVERDSPAGKKLRKQKAFSYDDGQNQDSEKSGESDKKQVTEEVEQGLSKKNAKKERSLEKKERASEHKELVLEKKRPNQKVENGIESKFPSKTPEVAKEVASPQKPKKPSIWTPKDESALAVAILHHVKAGFEVPVRRSNEFWFHLREELQGKADGDWTKEQLCDKLRRMKQRYQLMVDRMQAEAPKPYKHRTAHEESLFKIWTHIWGKDASGEQEGDEEEEEEDDAEAEWVKPVRKLSGSERNIEEIIMKKPETPVDQERERMDSSDDETDDEDDDEQVPKRHSTGMDIDQKQSLPPPAATMDTKPSDSSLDAVQHDQIVDLQNDAGHNTQADNKLLHLAQAAGDSSMDDFCKLLQAGNETLLREVQSSCKQMLEETQAKTLTAVERAINAAGEKVRFFNGMGFSGPSTFGIPVLAGGDFMDLKFLKEDDTAHSKLRQQWYQQHIEELKVYSQRLSLMQEYCHMQQEQLKSQFGTG